MRTVGLVVSMTARRILLNDRWLIATNILMQLHLCNMLFTVVLF